MRDRGIAQLRGEAVRRGRVKVRLGQEELTQELLRADCPGRPEPRVALAPQHAHDLLVARLVPQVEVKGARAVRADPGAQRDHPRAPPELVGVEELLRRRELIRRLGPAATERGLEPHAA